MKEIDKRLQYMILPFIYNKSIKILDAGSGDGHNTDMIRALSPTSTVKPIDQSFGSDILDEKSLFDISIMWQVLSFIPNPYEILDHVISITKSHVFISSLFYEGDMDFNCRIAEHKRNRITIYNTFSLNRFKEYIKKFNLTKIEIQDFKIPIELPLKDIDWVDSFTKKIDGNNEIFAGVIRQNWKLIRLDLPPKTQ